MIKQGLLDKHGKPTDKTPASYLQQEVAKMTVSSPSPIVIKEEKEFVIPSAGDEPPPLKRKVSFIHSFISNDEVTID
jgi:hypothetical protein